MTCALVIPPDGIMEIYTYETDWRQVADQYGSGPYVALDLIKDEKPIARALVSMNGEQPINLRGKLAIVELVGSWVNVPGPVIIYNIDEETALRLNQAVA